jgi:hypothetical protein
MIGFWDFKLSDAPPLLSFGVLADTLLAIGWATIWRSPKVILLAKSFSRWPVH